MIRTKRCTGTNRTQRPSRGERRRLAGWLAAALLAAGAALAQDAALVAEGEALYHEVGGAGGCAACHGPYGIGDPEGAGEVRGADADAIRASLELPEKAALAAALGADEIAAIAAFLEDVRPLEPVPTVVGADGWTPAGVDLNIDEGTQLIVTNETEATCTLELDGADAEPVAIAPGATGALRFRTPGITTTVEAYCGETPGARFEMEVESFM